MKQFIDFCKGPTNLEMIPTATRLAESLGWELCAITPLTDETGFAICRRPIPDPLGRAHSTHLVHMIKAAIGAHHCEFISGHYDMNYREALRNYQSRIADEIKYLSREG
jgi:hypothetical protein